MFKTYPYQRPNPNNTERKLFPDVIEMPKGVKTWMLNAARQEIAPSALPFQFLDKVHEYNRMEYGWNSMNF